MANTALSQNELNLADSLVHAEIPVKLRCAICNKLAVNAFRLPCCDQSICQNCQASLPEICPVCAHEPLSSDACSIQKALRLTCKAFLRSEVKKRDKSRAESAATSTTPTVRSSAGTASAAPIGDGAKVEPVERDTATAHSQAEVPAVTSADDGKQSQDAVQASVEISTKPPLQSVEDGESTKPSADEAQQQQDEQGHGGSQEPFESKGEIDGSQDRLGDRDEEGSQSQQAMFNQGFGFSNNQQGFSGMDWSNLGNMNPMMQMQMQNAMQNGNWSGFPNLMSMNGMGMDPMAMQQNMFNSFGGGMGTNGMNGMNNFNMSMGYGTGFSGGWNGQQSGMGMGGDFGAQNAGYYPSGGYNQHQSHQGSFSNQMNPHQRSQNDKFQNQSRFQGGRGFGRGRGNFRGNFQGQYFNQSQGQNYMQDGTNQSGFGGDDDVSVHQMPPDLKNRRPSQQAQNELMMHSLSNEPSEPPKTEESRHDTNEKAPTSQEEDTADPDALADREPNAKEDQSGAVEETSGANEDTVTEDQTAALDPAEQTNSVRDIDGVNHYEARNDLPNSYGQESDYLDMNYNRAGTSMMNQMNSMNAMGHQNSFYDQNTNQPQFQYRGRGGFGRGFRGGFRGRGRGGFHRSNHQDFQVIEANAPAPTWGPNGEFINPDEPKVQGIPETPAAPAPPPNAPSGPKAMRESQPNVGFRGRGGFPASSIRGTVPSTEEPGYRGSYNGRDDSLDRDQDDDSRPEKRRRHSRQYEDDFEDDRYANEYNDQPPKESYSRGEHESDEERRHRRREKEKYRSSRSHRDRSRDRSKGRHSRRDRSRSPAAEHRYEDSVHGEYENDEYESSSRRKSRSYRHRDYDGKDQDGYRDREDRDYDKYRERHHEHSKDRERRRSYRDKDYSDAEQEDARSTRRRSHRDRHRSKERSRRSSRHRRDSDREHDREYNDDERDRYYNEPLSSTSSKPSTNLGTKNTQTSPVEQSDDIGFKIKGSRAAAIKPPPPRNGPLSSRRESASSFTKPVTPTQAPPIPGTNRRLPPTGPKADRDRERRPSTSEHQQPRRPSTVSTSAPPSRDLETPREPSRTSAEVVDPLAAEREARNRERILRQTQLLAFASGRRNPGSRSATNSNADANVNATTNGSAGAPTAASVAPVRMSSPPPSAPTGPKAKANVSAGMRNSRRAADPMDLSRRISEGVREGRKREREKEREKGVGGRERYGKGEAEGEEERMRRVEREREAGRWG
ncbi:MAG: hypothetical protein M1820_001743 [Bogoriella megaspora]|nr:MAG: hypothetical protein M1820_001743 [Bogoriella megaspora]